MSPRARGYAERHAPAEMPSGQFLVLLMIADIANDKNGNRLYFRQAALARKCRMNVSTVRKHMQTIEAEEWVTRLKGGKDAGSVVEYRFLFTDRPVVFDDEDDEGVVQNSLPRSGRSHEGVVQNSLGGSANLPTFNQREPKKNQRENASASADAPARASKPRPRDQIWDALTAIFQEPTTESAKSARGKVVRSLKGAGDATPTEIHKRWNRLKREMPGVTLTEHALEKHWHTLTDAPAPNVGDDPMPDWRNVSAYEAWQDRQAAKDA